MRQMLFAAMTLRLQFIGSILAIICAQGFCSYFTVPEDILLSTEFAAAHWGPADVIRLDGPGESVDFCFVGLGEAGTGLKDNYPVDTRYGQIIPSHGNGDFSQFSAYALMFENLDTEAVTVSVFVNTGFTGVSGIPSANWRNDTFWQSAWIELAAGESKIITLYFDHACPWNIDDNPLPHTSGTDGVPTAINAFDRAEISAVGFEVAAPNGNSQAVLRVSPAEPSAEGIRAFITTEGTFFTASDTGRPWFYAGTNNYYIGIDNTRRTVVDELIADMVQMDLNVLRLWGFNDNPAKSTVLQGPQAGDYRESHFHMLDYVLDQASLHGIRLIIPLVNYWDDYGGMQQYMNWNGGGTRDDFYANTAAQTDFTRFAAYLLNRVNSVNGRIYKEDPTILAWQLANEPRYKKYGADSDKTELTDWIAGTADYLRHELGVRQLITIGMEGFYGTGSENAAKGGKDAFKWEQTDYIGQHADPSIDLAGFHIYQDHWSLTDEQSTRWIGYHIRDARRNAQLGKPVIMDEFGRNTTVAERTASYRNYLKTAYREMVNGINFWILYHDAYPNYDGFGVYYPQDAETVQVIQQYARKIALLNATGLHQLLSFEDDDEQMTCTFADGAAVDSILRVASPSWRLTDDGSVRIDCRFEAGGQARIGAVLTDALDGTAGIDVADYGYRQFTAALMIQPDAGYEAQSLTTAIYNKTASEATYACSSAGPGPAAGQWTQRQWPVQGAGDLSDLRELGIEISADAAFCGSVYVDFIAGDIGCPQDNLLPLIDLSGDKHVDKYDLLLMSQTWLAADPGLPGDINDDGVVNLADLQAISTAWGYPNF